jgi:hypothetical protein
MLHLICHKDTRATATACAPRGVAAAAIKIAAARAPRQRWREKRHAKVAMADAHDLSPPLPIRPSA